ncbi:hypothetical protein [Winogradskyella sp. UBA3174]|uniref:hypothetical protein n=1 Tax=Winogradskyella sp. UBA3174 TaxID=1947785 RepID=UPI0025F2A3DB|nr:hypothetical protein [Winogradskyella sp. UBA3174]|tara:strand:- start:844 stop:1353 length:510 start_codon:yes stop_codon:yes gene_type:complete
MKTPCTTLLLIAFNLILTAQSESDVINNIKYISEVVSDNEASEIKKIQDIAAYYNIENADVFDANKKSTYDVVFKKTNCKIEATYNSEGEILKTTEVYSDMRLPLSLVKLILKEHSTWYISDNVQKVYYSSKSGTYKVYELEIKKESKVEKLKFKIDSKDTSMTYVAMN